MRSSLQPERPAHENFDISYLVRTAWEMKEFHWHDAFEIFLALTDGVDCFVENRVYKVRRGDLFVFNPMVLHRTVLPEGLTYERYVISFGAEYIDEFSETCGALLKPFNPEIFISPVHLSESELAELVGLIKKSEASFCSDHPFHDIRKRLTLIEILLFIHSSFACAAPPVSADSDPNYKKIKPVIDYINSRLSDRLSLDTLSSKFFLCKSYLGKLFKKYTGFTVYEYIIYQRIAKARILLRKGVSVTRVCEETGFNSYPHFIRTFTKHVRVSPKQYAKGHFK